MSRPVCYLMIGLPCSGKSTWIANNPELKGIHVLSTDRHIEEYAASQNKTYNQVFKEYYSTAEKLLHTELYWLKRRQESFVYDQTNTDPAKRRNKLRKIPENYDIKYVVCDTAFETILARNVRPGKIIPLAAIMGMAKKSRFPSQDEDPRISELIIVEE